MSKYGVWLSLIAWVPVIGDVLVIALGFYKTPGSLDLRPAAHRKRPSFFSLGPLLFGLL